MWVGGEWVFWERSPSSRPRRNHVVSQLRWACLGVGGGRPKPSSNWDVWGQIASVGMRNKRNTAEVKHQFYCTHAQSRTLPSGPSAPTRRGRPGGRAAPAGPAAASSPRAPPARRSRGSRAPAGCAAARARPATPSATSSGQMAGCASGSRAATKFKVVLPTGDLLLPGRWVLAVPGLPDSGA